MEDYEKIIEALKIIKAHCEVTKDCELCNFYSSYWGGCGIREDRPSDWKLNEDFIIKLFK